MLSLRQELMSEMREVIMEADHYTTTKKYSEAVLPDLERHLGNSEGKDFMENLLLSKIFKDRKGLKGVTFRCHKDLLQKPVRDIYECEVFMVNKAHYTRMYTLLGMALSELRIMEVSNETETTQS